jgi:hypothetical protein
MKKKFYQKDILKQNNMITIDLYTENYLGELETILVEKNINGKIVTKLKLFSADFSSIIGWIPFNEFSDQNSVVYLFNMDLNWASELIEITQIQDFYYQLQHIPEEAHPLGLPVLNSLKNICKSVIENGNKLFIEIE